MPDRDAVLDEMIEFAMEELMAADEARRALVVRRMAVRWPEESALSLVYAITSAAAAIEDGAEAGDVPGILLGYRLSALASADIHAVQAMGQVPAVAEDLLHFWRRTDASWLH